MSTRRSRAVLVGAGCAAAFALTGPAPAGAAPYTPDTVVETPTTNPPVGGQLPLNAHGYVPGETVVFELHSTVVYLGSAVADGTGAAALVAQLPPGYRCQHFITATSPSHVARTDIVIGPPEACSGGSGNVGNGNPGNGNVGNGNPGDGNVGNGNTGDGNVGNGNTGSGNVGNGNHKYGELHGNAAEVANGDSTGWGNVGYTATAPSGDADRASAAAVAAAVGLATVGGIGFSRRRRQGA